MKLIIDRKLWARGEGEDDSSLLRDYDGKMCCLGFYGLACGLTSDDMRSIGTPSNLYRATKKVLADWLITIRKDGHYQDIQATEACTKLMTWNDAYVYDAEDAEDGLHIISEQERERLIAEEFAKHDVEVEFIN